jgi:hypothetical protein
MGNPNQINSRIYVNIDGKRQPLKAGTKFTTGGIERESVLGDAGVEGFSEKTSAPSIDATLLLRADVSLKQIQAIANSTIHLVMDGGKEFVFEGAWCEKANEVSGGEVSAKFGAMSCKEVK